MNGECPFCRIIAGDQPAQFTYQDELVVAFQDIHPIAPVHLLVIPRKHMVSLNTIEEGDEELLGHMIRIGQKIAAEAGVGQSGYRLVINTGADAGQAVFHVHMHVIGGRHLPFRFE